MKHRLVLLSGGMDSSVVLAQALHKKNKVSAVSFLYGQRHKRELDSAKLLMAYYRKQVPDQVGDHHILDLTGASGAFKGSALTGGGSVPEGHYEDKSMKQTVVPNRNMTLLSLASGVAIANNLNGVLYGAHAGDHAIYPDCREEFFEAFRTTLKLGNYNAPDLTAPFIKLSKADIAKTGIKLGVPFQLTWSCYKGGDVHCGKCGTCVERKEAFTLIKAEDPTEYQS